jgi:glycosyltransferase A (GT-A) superfamily protein (DUF2064 family)
MRKLDCRLIVFAKAPIPGEVKTRLLPFLDAETTSALHQQLVLHCLNTAIKAEVGEVDLWCTPTTEHSFFIRCAKKFKVGLYQQIEGDLGKFMANTPRFPTRCESILDHRDPILFERIKTFF